MTTDQTSSHLKSESTTRRSILKGAVAAAAFPTFLPKSVFGANEKKLNLTSGSGLATWAQGDLNNCANQGNNVVALCDCNPNEWVRAKEKFPEAKFYKDFRQMLDEMGDQIDAVGVGTPDHTHFAIAYTAMSMGNLALCRKAARRTRYGRRARCRRKRRKGVVTQMGNQGHAFEGAYLIKEWCDAELIGESR
ncbi:MAG: Gfo/Idh/MocA family oxidoreductase [Verrucomicrobiales bacterium]